MSDERERITMPTFRRRLADMKKRGCNLLVTGDPREHVRYAISRKMLGAPQAERQRVLALVEQEYEDAPRFLPERVSLQDLDVFAIDYPAFARGADAATSPDEAADGVAVQSGRLDDLEENICNTIALAESANDGLSPSELRFGLCSLGYLDRQHDDEAVDAFLREVTDEVRDVAGMGHYHLALPDDHDRVQKLAPLFDARVEVRASHGNPEQRWHLADCPEPTEWVGL